MKPLPLSRLTLFAILLAQLFSPLAAAQQASADKDGFTLKISFKQDENKPLIACSITNTSEEDIWIMLTTAANGFGVALYDSEGHLLPQDPRWARRYEPEPKPRAGRRNYKPTKPGYTVSFEVKLMDAYPNTWQQAKKAVITWYPGEDQYHQPIQRGRGITASLDLPAEAPPSPEVNEPAAEEKVGLKGATSDRSARRGKTSQTAK